MIYLAILTGLTYLATASELESRFTCGIVLFIVVFLSIWTIGRIIVNPVNRVWAIAMMICNVLILIYIIIHMVRNR